MITTVEYIDADMGGDYDLVLEVQQANVLLGADYHQLCSEMRDQYPAPEEGDERFAAKQMEWVVRVTRYPACITALVDVKSKGKKTVSKDMSVDDFLQLPQVLMEVWYEATLKVNPQWSPFWQVRSMLSMRRSSTGTPESGASETKKIETTGSSASQG